MSESIVNFLQPYGISPELIVFIISMLPILELRGGLLAASILRIPPVRAFIICYIANILPLPFILLFIQKIFAVMKRFSIFRGLVEWLERKAVKKSSSVRTKQLWGLFVFVAVPLPGTGGWTGSLIASVLEMPIKKTLPVVCAGVLVAGIIMMILTYFIPGIFGF